MSEGTPIFEMVAIEKHTSAKEASSLSIGKHYIPAMIEYERPAYLIRDDDITKAIVTSKVVSIPAKTDKIIVFETKHTTYRLRRVN